MNMKGPSSAERPPLGSQSSSSSEHSTLKLLLQRLQSAEKLRRKQRASESGERDYKVFSQKRLFKDIE